MCINCEAMHLDLRENVCHVHSTVCVVVGGRSIAGASSPPLFDSWIHFLGGAWPQWSWSALGASRGQH